MNWYVKIKVVFFFSVLLLCFSCKQGDNRQRMPDSRNVDNEELKNALILQNKQLILEELELIDAFCERYNLNMDTTSTGLRFKIVESTNGVPARLMNDVTISYTASLLNGNICYSSDSTGKLSFILGQSDQPGGLQEGLLKMKEGERALLIVPSYLAYGITGDGVCVPGSSSIFYKVYLEKVRE